MAQVVITLADTPTGGVSIKTDFTPAVGARCSEAQSAALDIIARTRKHYGLELKADTQAQAFAQACERVRQAREDHAEKRAVMCSTVER